MPGNAFVYGTLMADEVVSLLIRRIPKGQPAVLSGYKRYKVRGQVFPAILPSEVEPSKVQGKVLLDLTDTELNVLDAYESSEYYRKTVQPVLEDGTEVTADVYIWRDEYKSDLVLDAGDWDYSDFMQQHLKEYLIDSAEFMEECMPEQFAQQVGQ